MKKMISTIKQILKIFFLIIGLYIIGFFYIGFYSESIGDIETVEINKELELTSTYDEDVFEQLLSITDGEIKGAYLYNIYVKNDGSETVYMFCKEYTAISEFFIADSMITKIISIYYDNSKEEVNKIDTQVGGHIILTFRRPYMSDTDWTKIEQGDW